MKMINKETFTKNDLDILYLLSIDPFITQRILAESSGYSLGLVNKCFQNLKDKGYIDNSGRLTDLSRKLFVSSAPRNAIILAAGFGMRMVPINLSTPKAFLEVKGERLIERLINQLHEVGIKDITIVVGFMKDSFEYLIDKYDVELIVNDSYSFTNNMYSLFLASDRLKNTYIIPCDVWADENPFRKYELYSWYMVTGNTDPESSVRVNRKNELIKVDKSHMGNRMIGISYLLEDEAKDVRKKIYEFIKAGNSDNSFWEDALYRRDRMIVYARILSDSQIFEINTYEQLRELDSNSGQLKSEALKIISKQLACSINEIINIQVLKKGMTNRSFLFTAKGNKYIMRIPGEGTDQLINREQEAKVYEAIRGYGLCDDPVYINPQNGYKITKYLEKVRVCDANNPDDLKKCMVKLRQFHSLKLKVNHYFDIYDQIEFYEKLWGETKSIYIDYKRTKEKVLSLKKYIDGIEKEYCLTHIDAVPDNFLFYYPDNCDEEQIQLTDWEYSGMQDPHVDLAMFCIYSMYDKNHCDQLINLYFDKECGNDIKAKIYCYISACGLLWSNWCEYKRQLGVEFGEYSLRQYRFAKDFYRYATELMNQEEFTDD